MFFPGYAFLLFREEASVHRLVKRCLSEEGKLYMFVSSLTQSNKKVSSHCRDMYILHTLVGDHAMRGGDCVHVASILRCSWRSCTIVQENAIAEVLWPHVSGGPSGSLGSVLQFLHVCL